MALKKNIQRPESVDDYCLDRLFDEEQLYYTPMDELLKRYKKRDMIPGRIYNLAKKYGNVPNIRARIINAPQMERAGQRIFGTENFYYPPPKVYYCTIRNQTKASSKSKFDSSSSPSEDESYIDEDEKLSYKEWLNKRKQLRNGLNKLSLDLDFLKNKKDLTDVERRVLKQLTHVDKEIQTDPIKEKKVVYKSRSVTPKISYPTPVAMKQIEEFLNENKWRLVDLFKDLDKNKDWKVKKSDFIRECKKGRLDIPKSLIDELVIALSNPHSNKIYYKELAKGRTSHLSERRNELRESRESINSDDYNAFTQKSMPKKANRVKSSSTEKSKSSSNEKTETSSKSRSSSELTNSSNLLQLPKIDTGPGQYPFDLYEKKLMERAVSAGSLPSVNRSESRSSIKFKYIEAESKRKMEEIKEKNVREYVKCLNNSVLSGFKSKSSLLNGLVPPNDKNPNDIIRSLKQKSDEKKRELKRAQHEEKLRKRKLKLQSQK